MNLSDLLIRDPTVEPAGTRGRALRRLLQLLVVVQSHEARHPVYEMSRMPLVVLMLIIPSLAGFGANDPTVFWSWGMVRYVDLEDGFWGIVAYSGAQYLPVELPQEFRQDGLGVRFAACLAPDTDTTTLWGTPIQLMEIEAVAVDPALVAGQTAFALELFRILAYQEANLCISPLSVFTALAMTYAGARGETKAQMKEVLRFPHDDPEALHSAIGALVRELTRSAPGHELKMPNALWTQRGYPFLKDFLELVQAYYRAALAELDFAGDAEGARATINAWVAEATEGHIPELLVPGSLESQARLVLTNAVYFRGLWQMPFPPERTKPAPFYRADGQQTEISLMHQEGRFRYAEFDQVQILELPYAGHLSAMLIVLPRRGTSLDQIEAYLTPQVLDSWISALEVQPVEVWLPIFTVSSGLELQGTLAEMGMPAAFSPQADFSGMTVKRGLFISKVAHQALVEVSEEGTEAAAATAVVVRESGLACPPVIFRADRPFLFLVRDLSAGTILFLGRLADPDGR